MTLSTEEIPICHLPDCWALASLEDGTLFHLGDGSGAALIWTHRVEAEDAAERLGGRYVPVMVRVDG